VDKQNNATNNPELQDLATHSAGAVDLHKTRTTASPVQINPPIVENPGPYDTRTGNFDTKHTNEK
jgi:hypothetical protein